MVKKSEFLPSFDERFINYAYNKVEWIEHLRYRGYAFRILTKGFGVDVPHPMSGWAAIVRRRSKLRREFKSAQDKNRTLNLDLFNTFTRELNETEVDKSVVHFCKKKH